MRIKTLNIFWVAIAIIFAGSPMYAQVFVHEYNSPDGITYSLDKETHTAQVTMLGNVPDRIDIPPYISVNDTVFTVISFDVTDYSDLDNVLVLSLPSSLQYLKPGSINLFPNIQELYSWAVNPPLVSEDISERVLFIADDDTPSCTLYVPAISLQLYNSDPCWNSFTATSAIDAPITSIIVSDSLYITVPENTHVSELILSPHINAGIFGHLTVKGNGLSADYFTMRYDRNADYDQNQDEVQHINDATLIADNNLISANTATEMVIMPYRWNFISFPYDVKVSDIRYPDSADFVIRRYDGSARAVSDFDGSWKEMTIDSTLRAGEGYIIQVRNYSIFTYDYEDYSSVGTFDNGAPLLTFPTSASTMFSSGSITVSLNDYPSEFKQNRGWNFVGNPYPCCFDMKYTDYSGTYWVWDYYSDSFVSKSTEYDDYVLLPGEAFFIQCPKEKHSITFNPEGRRHERKEILHSSKVSMRGGYPALESAFRMPLASVGTHGYWDPDNPGEPGCNLWNPDLGRIVIDYYKAGGLGTAIDNAIGLTEGHTYFDETVAQIRGRVKEIVIVGPFDASDIWAYHDYTECMVLDLSRTTGWRKIPTGAFSESTLHTILLPECIDSIGPSAFNNYSGLSALHLHSLIPPVVDTDAFDSIPKGATAYVPASAYPLYLTNSIWSQINIAPFTDQVGTISVSLPSDWTDGRYKGLKIQATSNEYGHKSSFLITEKGTYQFNNLVKDGSYKVELKRNDGITLSLIDDIVASQDGTQALLPDIFNMYSDVVKVFTAEGLDITSQCIVKWYNADGGVIGENYLIKDITLGSKLDYTITLPERYALEYTLSDSVFSFTQGPENAVLQHALTSIPKKRIEGIICDANNGQPIDGAQIIASYRINGGYTRSFTAQSLQDGTFSMEIPKRDGILTVVADGFFDKSTSFDVSSPEPLSISMERLSGQKLFISLSYTTAGDEENAPVTTQGYSETSDLKYSFYNNEKCGELKGYRIQYPYIWFVSDTIDTNDCISVNVSSKKGVFETIETELFFKDNGQDTLNINIHERGRLKVRYASANDKYFNVILFNQEGNKISGAQSTAKEVLIKNIPEGTYTVVAASGKNGNISITRLEQLDELGLEADVDYVSSQAWVERGWINKIEFESLPVLDITSKNYLTWASLESEKVKVYDGDFTTLDCQFSFRPDLLENMDNVNAVIDLPAGCAFKKGSVLLNGVPADADLVASGNAYKVIIPIQEGTMANRIRLSVVPSLSGTAYFAASVNFMSNDIRQTALIGSTQVRVEGIAIHAQRMTIKDSISISGTAPADASVLIYDGDKLIASTTASLAHQWFVRAGLVDAELLSRHPISAQIQSENGWVSTDTVSCLYNPYGVYNAGVLMELYSPQVHYDVCDVYESRQLGEKKIPKTYEPFSPGWFNNTTEGMAAKESIAFELGISRSGGGGYGLMPWDDYYSWNGAAVYFDAERGEAEPSYTLGNFNAFVYRFQAMFPDCDSTDVSDVVFHVILEDSVVNKIPGHFVEPGHWEGSRAYSSDGALPVNVSKITYTPKKTLPYDSIPSIKNLNALINEEYERAQKTARLHELKESALAIESRPELSDADKDLLQRYLNEGMSLYSYKPSVTLSDEQLQYIESIQGLDYEGFFEALKDLPGADISQDMIDYILGRNKDYPIYGTIEPREIYPGFYSPRVTYNFRYSNGITDILQPDHQWDFQYSDDHKSIVISDSEGNYLKLEDIMPANSSLVRQRGDEIVKSILPSQKDVDAALNTISNEVNAAGMASATVGAAADIVMNNFKDAANALGLAEGASVVGGLGEIAGGLGAVLDGKAAWDALNRDNHSGWLELGRGNQDVMGADFLMQTEAIAQGVSDWNGAVAFAHFALAAVGLISMVAFGPVGGFIVGVLCYIGSSKLDSMDKQFQAENANLLAMWQDYINGKRTNDSKPNRDPSGFVYEAVESNRLSDVTATVYQKYMAEDIYGDWHEVIIPWDAESYDQVNPQQTDQEGMYAWDVPEGEWRVVFSKEGYEPDTTGWLSVPPPQLDVNVGLISYAAPYIKAVRAFEQGIDIYFSKYMRSLMLTDANIAVTYNGVAVPGQIELIDVEWGPEVEEELASKVRFVPDDITFSPDENITLIVSSRTESYAGVPMESNFVQEFPVEREVEYIYVPETVNLRNSQTAKIIIEAGPVTAASGHKAVITVDEGMTVSVSADTVTFDTLGIAGVDIKALSIGQTILDVKIMEYDLSGSVQVNVLPDSLFPAPPYASIESGEKVQPGTSVRLLCDSLDYTIYYTLDGTDPLDPDNPESYRYDEPIVIDSAVTVIAIVEANGLYSYPATFTYQVTETGIRIIPKDKAAELLHDLQGRPLDKEPELTPFIHDRRIEIKK